VPSLYPEVRPAARFSRTLAVLTEAKRLGSALFWDGFRTKSGLMLGLGETEKELMLVLAALVEAGVDLLTLGQYLRPTRHQLPVRRYVHPDEFAELGRKAKALGFRTVYAGPLVRSSFNAFEISAIEGISIA
jgi:lipoic acid synthetase